MEREGLLNLLPVKVGDSNIVHGASAHPSALFD